MKKLCAGILAIACLFVAATAFAGGYRKIKDRDSGECVIVHETPNPNFFEYRNGRFGVRCWIPKNFKNARLPQNGDGCSFMDEYGSVLSVSGMNNAAFLTLNSLYRDALAAHPNCAYKKCGKTYYVVSYKENHMIIYEKTFVFSDVINTLYFEYPESLARRYNPLVKTIESSFRHGPNVYQ